MSTRQRATFDKRFQPDLTGPLVDKDEGFIHAHDFMFEPDREDHLFTLVDPNVGSGMQYWVPGYHVVNRIGYVYTVEPWDELDRYDEYRRW